MPHFRDAFLGPTNANHNNNLNLLTPGQINLLSADPPNNNNIDTGIQLWQNQSSAALFHPGSSPAVLSCQDCGNQAKKDCAHRRCRTCCKSRGFDCTTHVKSTWVPAARRRERQLVNIATATATAGSSASTSAAKKPRLINIASQTTTTSHTSTSNTPPRSFETTSSHHQVVQGRLNETMPGQVRATAVFKCVRVTAVDDGEDEYAYQAVVKIGGHIFKGFLYDQGAETRDGFPNMSDLHLGPVIDPPSSTDVYATAAALGGLLGGGLGSAYGGGDHHY